MNRAEKRKLMARVRDLKRFRKFERDFTILNA